MVLWYIWKSKNHNNFYDADLVHNSSIDATKVMINAIENAKSQEVTKDRNGKQRQWIGWKYPPMDWKKLNIDGCNKMVIQ